MSLAIFRSRRMAVVFLLGFSSGLPLLLTGQTLGAWLTAEGLSLEQIASISIVGLAYTFKFTWAPLLDRFRLPFLGRRRGWILVTQVALFVAIFTMSMIDPRAQPGLLLLNAFAIAVLSASQDIVIDGYNTEIFTPEQRAAGAATYVVGYRIAMLLAGWLPLFLADWIEFRWAYLVLGSLMFVGVAATMLAEEPAEPQRPVTAFYQAVYLPFYELWRRFGKGALLVLLFVAVYKFGDSFVQPVLIAFFRRGLDYPFAEIATIYKFLGFSGMFIGGIGAGTLVAKFGLRKTLFAFGILQASTNLLYAWLAAVGPTYPLWGAAVFLDNVAGAMGTAAFVAFLMSVCTPGVSATQYALLTSLSSVGQRVFGPFTDDIIVRLDGEGIGQLAATSGTIDQQLAPVAERAVASFEWNLFAPLGELASLLPRALNPRGDLVIIDERWPLFFTITTLMAIPGLILALVVAKYGDKT